MLVQKCWVENLLPKRLWLQKNCASKNFAKNLGSKKLWVQKTVEPKHNLGPKIVYRFSSGVFPVVQCFRLKDKFV